LGEDVMHMVRRLAPGAAVRKPDTDAEMLRLTASAANDAVDAISMLAGPRAIAALSQVSQRYARALSITTRDITDALQAARETLRKGVPMPQLRRGDTAHAAFDDAPAQPRQSAPTAVDPTPASQ
jgi:eukaryotic-like serine/threonine-protein kinase